MQTQHIWKPFQNHIIVRLVVKVSIVAVGLLLAGTTVRTSLQNVQAGYLGGCSAGDRSYLAVAGDTLDNIAARYGTDRSILVKYNHITGANSIYTHQLICIPQTGTGSTPDARNVQMTRSAQAHSPNRTGDKPAGNRTGYKPAGPGVSQDPAESTSGHGTGDLDVSQGLAQPATSSAVGYRNVFPYGSCTWWADQRYYQLHGFFVPWTSHANAGQWVARAYQFDWHVSRFPAVGDIMVLQPGVQGAYRLGHVAVVERILSNGHVIASSMSWGSRPWAVTTWQFTPGPGVAFVTR